MKKYTLLLLLLLCLGLQSCSFLFRTAFSIKNPQVQTNEQIAKYLDDLDCPIQNTFVIDCEPDSVQIYSNLMKGFSNEILIYKDSVRYCYQGASRCSGVKLKATIDEFEESYSPCKNDTINFKNYLSKLTPLSQDNKLQIEQGKIYFFAHWTIFFGSKNSKKEDFEWFYEFKENYPEKYEIVLINTDLNEKWGLEKGKKMKMRFRKTILISIHKFL